MKKQGVLERIATFFERYVGLALMVSHARIG